MTISHVGGFKEHHIDSDSDHQFGLDQGLVHEPSQADADLFSTAMQVASVAAPQAMLPAALAGALADRVQSSDNLSQQAMRHMKHAARADDPTDLTEMSRTLSEYSLQTAVTTKVVNKIGQTLDKLTNLQ